MEAAAEKSLYGFDVRVPDERRKEDRETYNIKQLWQRSHEIIGLALQGLKYTEIADILGITPQTVSNTLNSDLGKEKLATLRERRDDEVVNVLGEIERLRKKALQVYEDIIDNDTVSFDLKKKTADTILLDIDGNRAPTKFQSTNAHFIATEEEIAEFKQRGLKAAKESGMLIDVTPGKDES